MSPLHTPKSPLDFSKDVPIHYTPETLLYINTYQYDDISDIHYHDHSGSFELALVIRGFGYHYINNHVKEVSKGDIIFIDPGSWHSLFPVDRQNSTCLQVINCVFSHEVFSPLTLAFPQLAVALSDLHSPDAQHPLRDTGNQLDRELAAFCQPLVQHIEFLYRQNDSKAEQSILLMLSSIVLEIHRKLSQVPTGFGEREQNPLLQRALKLIHESYLNPNFTIAELYSQLYVSKSHLCTLFRGYMDTTPVQLLSTLRIRHACAQLRQEMGKVKKDLHICCGYHEYNTFYINFKKITGLSIRDYVKALKFGLSIEENTPGGPADY